MLPLLLLIVFPFLFWTAWKSVRLSSESAGWPGVPGAVTASDRVKKAWRTQPHVTYTYEVDGKAYSGSMITFAAAVPGKEVDPILTRYPVGSAVTVHYSPKDPSVAVLEPGPNRYVTAVMRSYVIWFVFIVVLNAINYLVAGWSAAHQETGAPVRTYDDLAAADPGLGDQMIREGADKGDAKDEGYVGAWYFGGLEGYPKDPAEAAKWFEKSADQGDAGSQTLLGEMYAKGEGVPKDFAKAVEWFQKGAAQGNPHSCVGLGMAYEKGVANLPRDKEKAIEWYKKAGDDPLAKQCLARIGAE